MASATCVATRDAGRLAPAGVPAAARVRAQPERARRLQRRRKREEQRRRGARAIVNATSRASTVTSRRVAARRRGAQRSEAPACEQQAAQRPIRASISPSPNSCGTTAGGGAKRETTAISCSRRVASASSRHATLPHAARRTRATAPKRSQSERRTPPTCSSFSGTTRAPALVGVADMLAEARLDRVRSACACSSVTPGFSRPTVVTGRALRAARTAVARHRSPDLRGRRRIAERRRHDADDGAAGAAERERAADDGRIGGEPRRQKPSLITTTGGPPNRSSCGAGDGRAPVRRRGPEEPRRRAHRLDALGQRARGVGHVLEVAAGQAPQTTGSARTIPRAGPARRAASLDGGRGSARRPRPADRPPGRAAASAAPRRRSRRSRCWRRCPAQRETTATPGRGDGGRERRAIRMGGARPIRRARPEGVGCGGYRYC